MRHRLCSPRPRTYKHLLEALISPLPRKERQVWVREQVLPIHHQRSPSDRYSELKASTVQTRQFPIKNTETVHFPSPDDQESRTFKAQSLQGLHQAIRTKLSTTSSLDPTLHRPDWGNDVGRTDNGVYSTVEYSTMKLYLPVAVARYDRYHDMYV